MGLSTASWVKLNRLRSGVGCFFSSMQKWSLVPFSNCECGDTKQTIDHIISQFAHIGHLTKISILMVLNDKTRC